jgi:hypothetical protein
MEYYLLAYIAISLLLVLLIVLNLNKRIPQKENPYSKVGRLLSPVERSFFAVLCQACDNKAIVFSKTQVSGVLNAQRRLVKLQKQKIKFSIDKNPPVKSLLKPQKNLNKVAKNSFDFIVCDRRTLQVIAVIELDSVTAASAKTSAKEKAQQNKRNRKLEAACKTVQLELHQFNGTQKYSVTDIEMALFNECADRSALTSFESD